MLVIDRFCDVDVATKVVAALDLDLVVGRGQHHDGGATQFRVRLEALQDIDTAHVRKIEIEQDEQVARVTTAEQALNRTFSVGSAGDRIADARAAQILLDQPGVAVVVLDENDGDGVHCCFQSVLGSIHRFGRVTVKMQPCPGSDANRSDPPRRRTSARTWARPMPSPFWSRIPERRNSSNTRSASFGSIPRPLSPTS